ncbi:Gfo/Idh/MocA family protein [Paenibacillus nasutitermitis]|uniref:Oxidoreductase n=1 Tax=Paenibacillus nasutitermitis TaxID=1652958 RepID=A0A916YLN0_9BACL|nr:Gfo/Idh/MocA family oxidoreductase [Paenibacillus nasutitermitis]GGD50243.1 oxidoreductase [Paenibacillus nasutitermitis]
MKSLNFAIIGCQHAHIGIFIEEMLAMGHRCSGLYEPDNTELADRISLTYGLRQVREQDELLGDDVDIIGCAAINCDKIDIIERCEQAGKPIMVDKPAVTGREGLDRLGEVLGRNRIQLGMLLTERFRPVLQTARRLLAEGALGEIVHLAMRKPHLLKEATRPSWHFDKTQSGGIIIDLFIHDFDLLRWLTGKEIRHTNGYMSKAILPQYPSFYDGAGLQVMLEEGITSELYADWHSPEGCWTWGDGRIFITGTKGTMELRLEGDPLAGSTAGMLLMTTDKEALRQIETDAPSGSVTADFLNRLEGKPHLLTHRDILAASEAAVDSDERAERVIRSRPSH